MRLRALGGFLAWSLWALSCGQPPPGTDAGATEDAGAVLQDDGGSDAGTAPDGGSDAGADAGNDAGSDAGADAGADAGSDAGTDAGSDAGADAGSDAGFAAVTPACGNNLCEPGETQACADCPATTGACGDGTCNFGESSVSCAADCRPIRVNGTAQLALPDLGTGRWKNFEGGLYPGGSNVPPDDHLAVGRAAAASIRPLDVDGQPSASGKIVMISIGMSNTTQEFCAMNGVDDTQPAQCRNWSAVGRWRDDTTANHATLVLINGARGGMSIENWVSTPVMHTVPVPTFCQGGFANPSNTTLYPNTTAGQAEKLGVFGSNGLYDEEYDRIAACNLKANGYSFRQVQVAWVKLSKADNTSNMLPDQNADAYRLEAQLGDVMRTLKARFPNLKQVYLSSRVFGGYTGGTIAEPYAYETGFAVKWLIGAQINQRRNGGTPIGSGTPGFPGDLNDANGTAPWLAWGPYLWANSTNPTSGSATWFNDVSGGLYAGSLASETTSTFTQALTLPASNAGSYYLNCGAGLRAVTPGPSDSQAFNRWCESDFYTLTNTGQRVAPASYGWASDGAQEDGTHPTHDGEAKVGTAFLRFFKNAPTAACWFNAGSSCP